MRRDFRRRLLGREAVEAGRWRVASRPAAPRPAAAREPQPGPQHSVTEGGTLTGGRGRGQGPGGFVSAPRNCATSGKSFSLSALQCPDL